MTLEEFAETYWSERPRWLSMIRRHADGDEEDILHNALLQCLHLLPRIYSIGFLTWKIKRQIWKDLRGNTVTSKGRVAFRQRCLPLSEVVEAEDNGLTPADYRYEEALTHKIETGEVLALLSEKSRRVFTSYYIESCELGEIAERELSTPGYIKTILNRGRTHLRQKIGPVS